jgi:hypothetical protein
MLTRQRLPVSSSSLATTSSPNAKRPASVSKRWASRRCTRLEEPPEQIIAPQELAKPWLSRKGRRIGFAGRDAANRRLGELGEQFVVGLERRRLLLAGRDDLAPKVQWVTKDIGDGLGFDVLSFDEADDSEKLVEVKTTGLGKFFPFYVTANEVRCSEDQAGEIQPVPGL